MIDWGQSENRPLIDRPLIDRGESAKREACMELVQSAMDGGHRMLIFSQFTSMLALLEELRGQRSQKCPMEGQRQAALGNGEGGLF